MNFSPPACAAELLETVPLLMRVIRAKVRSHRGPELSVPQFRTLAFIARNRDTTLSDVAAHLGLTLPSTSKLIEGLVAAKLARREIAAGDRRCIALTLMPAGQQRYEIARSSARDFFAEKLASLGRPERAEIFRAAQLLKKIFGHAEADAGPTEFQKAGPRRVAEKNRAKLKPKNVH